MPLDRCHPTAPHKKLRLPEWYVSSLMMDRALDAVVRRAKKFDRKHDIPYLAGYSLDGKTVYIDRHMPRVVQIPRPQHRDRSFSDPARRGRKDADRSARTALSARPSDRDPRRGGGGARRGIKWRDYDRFMQKYVKRIGDERLTKVPNDLDLKPYRDEHDDDLLRRMLISVRAGKAPKGIHVRDLAEAIKESARPGAPASDARRQPPRSASSA